VVIGRDSNTKRKNSYSEVRAAAREKVSMPYVSASREADPAGANVVLACLLPHGTSLLLQTALCFRVPVCSLRPTGNNRPEVKASAKRREI